MDALVPRPLSFIEEFCSDLLYNHTFVPHLSKLLVGVVIMSTPTVRYLRTKLYRTVQFGPGVASVIEN